MFDSASRSHVLRIYPRPYYLCSREHHDLYLRSYSNSRCSIFVSGNTLFVFPITPKLSASGARLEITLVDIHDTPHNNHLNFQDMPFEDIDGRFRILHARRTRDYRIRYTRRRPTPAPTTFWNAISFDHPDLRVELRMPKVPAYHETWYTSPAVSLSQSCISVGLPEEKSQCGFCLRNAGIEPVCVKRVPPCLECQGDDIEIVSQIGASSVGIRSDDTCIHRHPQGTPRCVGRTCHLYAAMQHTPPIRAGHINLVTQIELRRLEYDQTSARGPERCHIEDLWRLSNRRNISLSSETLYHDTIDRFENYFEYRSVLSSLNTVMIHPLQQTQFINIHVVHSGNAALWKNHGFSTIFRLGNSRGAL